MENHTPTTPHDSEKQPLTQFDSTAQPPAEHKPDTHFIISRTAEHLPPFVKRFFRFIKRFLDKGPKSYVAVGFVAIFAGWGVYALLASFAATPLSTKTWSTAADWNAGTLNNVTVSGNTVTMATTVASNTGGNGSGSNTAGSGTGSGNGSGNAGSGSGTSIGDSPGSCNQTFTNGTHGLLSNTVNLQVNEFSSGAAFQLSNDCGSDFKIAKSSIDQGGGGVPGAYPSLYVGCHWGTCTSGSHLPVLNSDLISGAHKVTTTYKTTTIGSGKWDDAYDIWYEPSNNLNGSNNDGLELMIWLNSGGGPCTSGCSNTIGSYTDNLGNTYHVNDNGSNSGATVSFVMNKGGNEVTGLDLGGFTKYLVSKGLMPNNWSLTDIEAGFEIWQGGAGLTANNFGVTVDGTTTAYTSSPDITLASTKRPESPSGTVIHNNSSESILDHSGDAWSVSQGTVHKNGNSAGFTKNVTILVYVNGVIWQENSSNLWWSWNGSGWDPAGGTSTSPLGGESASASGTVVQNNSNKSIIDNSHAAWTVSGGLVYQNGTPAGFTTNVTEIAYVNGVIWQENSSNLWWSWNGSGWDPAGGTSTSPLGGESQNSGGTTTGGGTTDQSVLSGTITLTFNAGAAVAWSSLTGHVTTPSGTTISDKVRTSTDSTNWSAWTSATSTGDISQAATTQYLQIQVTLSRTNATLAPILNSLTLAYSPQSTSNGGSGGGTNNGGGTGSEGLTVGSGAPPSDTSATVDFRTNLNVPALNTYSIGDTLSTYPASDGSTLPSNANYKNTLGALGPLAWRVPLRDTNGTPTGAGAGGGGIGYVQAIKDIKGVPVVIAAGQTADNDFNDSQITNLVKYYNDNGGQNGGPVTSWIVGNEPGINNGGIKGDAWTSYKNLLPGAINAIKSADPSIPVKISAGAVFSQSLISSLGDIAGDQGITYLGWHAYEGADGNGGNSGQYAGALYEAQEQQAASIAASHNELSGIEEFNWNADCNLGNHSEFGTWQNELFTTSVIGNILAGGGAHAYMYSDTNGNSGCDTLSSATNGQRPAYWALGMWTGMNGTFDRFGSNLVDTKVNNIDVTNASGKEGSGLAHEVELFATSNGKILAINKNGSTNEPITIGLGGLTTGTYNVWQTNKNNVTGPGGAPTEVVKGASFSGSKITITLPAGTISSIDVRN